MHHTKTRDSLKNPASDAVLRRLNILAGGLLALALLFAQFSNTRFLESLLPPCIFKQITHLPCLFCGFTRSIVTLLQGDLGTSVQYHPLGFPLFAATAGFLMLSLLHRETARTLLRIALHRRTVFGIMSLLILTWAWKMTQDPAFW